MSTGASNDCPEREVLYTVHHVPGSDDLPEIPKKKLRIPCLERPMRYRRQLRTLYAVLSVGDVKQRYDLDKDTRFDFTAKPSSTLNIELYVEQHKGDACVASSQCGFASLAASNGLTDVSLVVCDKRVTAAPSLRVGVTKTAIGEDMQEAVEQLGKELSLPEKWVNMGNRVRMVVDIGVAVSEINPIAKAVVGLVKLGCEGLERMKDFHKDIYQLLDQIIAASDLVRDSDSRGFEGQRDKQTNACRALVPEIYCALTFVRSLSTGWFANQFRGTVNAQVKVMLEGIQKAMDGVKEGQQADAQDTLFRVESIVARLEIASILSQLPAAENVQAGSSTACLPGTRVELLKTILEWVFAVDGSRSFFLTGLAGKGKSAVAHSVATMLNGMGVVAPFFAFDRSDRTRQASQLYPTLAKQLARCNVSYGERLRAMRPNQLDSLDIQDQYRNLMSKALSTCQALAPIVFVVDAVDECPNSGQKENTYRDTLLKTLRACIGSVCLHPNIRFLLTARPVPDIRLLHPDQGIPITWKSIDDAEGTKSDIRTYVDSQLSKFSAAGYIDIVTGAAQDHFECAALLCRELKGPKVISAAKRSDIIERVKAKPGYSLYDLYRVILESHLDTTDEVCMSTYRQVLSWIFAVRSPQPLSVFLELAEVANLDASTRDIIEGLGSLLTGTVSGDSSPLRPAHASFRDFLLDKGDSGIFSIASEPDAQLAYLCFQLMKRPTRGLRLNICDLRSPFIFKQDVKDLTACVRKCISPGLQYACRETSAHLMGSMRDTGGADLQRELGDFFTNRVIFWIEACSWLEIKISQVLQTYFGWLQSQATHDLVSVVSQSIAFEKRFREAITSSPSQAYICGRLFSPRYCQVQQPNLDCPIIIAGFEPEQHWPPNETLVINSGHGVNSVSFSPDGTCIISGSDDGTVRVWNAATGQPVGDPLRGHGDYIGSVAFSPDGTRIISGSSNKTVRVWNAATGQPVGVPLCGHEHWIRSVAFSPDGTRIISGSSDKTVRVWDAATGQPVGDPLRGHEDYITVEFPGQNPQRS